MINRKVLEFAMAILWCSDSSVGRATDRQSGDVGSTPTRGSPNFSLHNSLLSFNYVFIVYNILNSSDFSLFIYILKCTHIRAG